MKEYLLGIDLGTSGTKTVLFRSDGTAMAAHTVEYPLYQPQNGWAEQEPSDWWRAVRETVQAVLHKSGVAAADVAGVGISGQMHGLVMLDERGEVLHRSILWCDGRTGEECREITETVGAEKLIAITANPALAGFTAGKILWVRKHLPEVYKACRHILLAYISGMDTFALGLRKALELKADGRLDQFVKERYSSYDSGVGKKIVDGEMTLESLADYAEGLKSFDVPSGRQEYLESVVNRVLFH